MYQFFETETLKNLAINLIVLTRNSHRQINPFIFYCQNDIWFQLYCDESVLFIVPVVETDFDDYLQELDLEILARFFVDIMDDTNLTFNVKNQTLSFENTTLNLMLGIENDSFKVVNFENFNTSKKLG